MQIYGFIFFFFFANFHCCSWETSNWFPCIVCDLSGVCHLWDLLFMPFYRAALWCSEPLSGALSWHVFMCCIERSVSLRDEGVTGRMMNPKDLTALNRPSISSSIFCHGCCFWSMGLQEFLWQIRLLLCFFFSPQAFVWTPQSYPSFFWYPFLKRALKAFIFTSSLNFLYVCCLTLCLLNSFL